MVVLYDILLAPFILMAPQSELQYVLGTLRG